MLYELTMFGTYFGQQIINRWNYVSSGVPASASGSFLLLQGFGAIPDAGVYPAGSPFVTIMSLLSAQFSVTNMIARAASDYAPTDFYERPFPTSYSGALAGDAMSPVNAYGFRTNRVRLDVARGTKRFVGVVESEVTTGGVITASPTITLMESVAEKMSDVLSVSDEGNTVTFSPCVCSKLEYTTERGNRAYKYYPTLVQQLEHTALGVLWQPYFTVRSQTSRQYGRGA